MSSWTKRYWSSWATIDNSMGFQQQGLQQGRHKQHHLDSQGALQINLRWDEQGMYSFQPYLTSISHYLLHFYFLQSANRKRCKYWQLAQLSCEWRCLPAVWQAWSLRNSKGFLISDAINDPSYPAQSYSTWMNMVGMGNFDLASAVPQSAAY